MPVQIAAPEGFSALALRLAFTCPRLAALVRCAYSSPSLPLGAIIAQVQVCVKLSLEYLIARHLQVAGNSPLELEAQICSSIMGVL